MRGGNGEREKARVKQNEEGEGERGEEEKGQAAC